jgi:hypothetical protein
MCCFSSACGGEYTQTMEFMREREGSKNKDWCYWWAKSETCWTINYEFVLINTSEKMCSKKTTFKQFFFLFRERTSDKSNIAILALITYWRRIKKKIAREESECGREAEKNKYVRKKQGEKTSSNNKLVLLKNTADSVYRFRLNRPHRDFTLKIFFIKFSVPRYGETLLY